MLNTCIPDAVDRVVCAPDDGWWYHPKHVEQFLVINKLCNVASCWIYIGILVQSFVNKFFTLKVHPVFCAAPHSLRLFRSDADTDVCA